MLTQACTSIGEQVSRTRAVLLLLLLQFFRIGRPCAISAFVLLAVKHEKVCRYMKEQPNQPIKVRCAVGHTFHHFTGAYIDYGRTTLFAGRKVLAANFESIPQLLQFARRFTAT